MYRLSIFAVAVPWIALGVASVGCSSPGLAAPEIERGPWRDGVIGVRLPPFPFPPGVGEGDAGAEDAATPDASALDASSPDASSPDASSPDASSPDASTPDASTPDASTPDASAVDAAVPDAQTPPVRPLPADMVAIPAGTFTMGCSLGDIACAASDSNEQPRHGVTLSAFYIDRDKVTVSKYAACVATGPCGLPQYGAGALNWGRNRDAYPINGIKWGQAKAYCEFVGRRLPTEAEWERAARGDLVDARYPWGNMTPVCIGGQQGFGVNSVAVLVPNTTCMGGDTTIPVPGGLPNAFGLRDVMGNGFEFTSTIYGFYGSAPEVDPQGPPVPPTDAIYAQRGCVGGGSLETSCRVSARIMVGLADNSAHNGLRCAMTP